VLAALGIPTYAVFDADGEFEARAKNIGKTQDKIHSERAGHVAANRALLRYFGLPEEDFPVQIAGESVAIFRDQLESFLEAEWPEWGISC